MSKDKELLNLEAKKLVKVHGDGAIEVVKNKIKNLNNQHSRESDFTFLLLTEVERLVESSIKNQNQQ